MGVPPPSGGSWLGRRTMARSRPPKAQDDINFQKFAFRIESIYTSVGGGWCPSVGRA